jgi:hypothetical protein
MWRRQLFGETAVCLTRVLPAVTRDMEASAVCHEGVGLLWRHGAPLSSVCIFWGARSSVEAAVAKRKMDIAACCWSKLLGIHLIQY